MLGQIVSEAAERFGDRRVVVTPGTTLTYRDLHRRSSELAAGLVARGVQPGDPVALCLVSGPEWLIAAVAIDRIGAIIAGVSAALTGRERAELVELVAPRLVLCDESTVDGLPLRVDVAMLASGAFGAELAVAEGSVPVLEDDDERPAAICFTSGTTGRAKGALFRVRQLRAIQRIDLGPDAESTWGGGSDMLASTQFAHVGMTTKFPWYLRTGSTLHVMSRWRADDALRTVSANRMTTIGCVAPQLALMLRSPLVESLDLSSVAAIIAGGAASPPALVEAARTRFGAAYSIRYSSTESGGVGLGTAFDAPDSEAMHTVGRPRPGVEARIVGSDDVEIERGETGELQIRSDAVMDGYWLDPTASAAALTPDRWLRTGDLARIDESGCVQLCGRRTDMYIRGGYNVFPTEVEAVLSDHDGVADVVVVPIADEVMGEIGAAMIVAAAEQPTPTLDDLRRFGEARLARHKLPERLVICDEIPLTTAQKVDRRAARADALALLGK